MDNKSSVLRRSRGAVSRGHLQPVPIMLPSMRDGYSSASSSPRTVVVGDMVVADDSDSEADVGVDGDDSDPDRPKILRVISCSSRPARGKSASEPSWHALLRRTGDGRTASIARTVPHTVARTVARTVPHTVARTVPHTVARTVPHTVARTPPRNPTRGAVQAAPHSLQLSHVRTAVSTPSRIIRTDAPQRPAVNVPAKVLVPRGRGQARLVFPLLSRSRIIPLGAPLGVPVAAAAPARADSGDASRAADQSGGRRGAPPRGPQAHPHHPHQAVLVAGPGEPLSGSEKELLSDVLDMMQEQGVTDIQVYMAQYGVSASDTFHDW